MQCVINCVQLFQFLSTPSARRATAWSKCNAVCSHDFYPRPPRGGRPVTLAAPKYPQQISIHALREEGDPYMPEVFHDVMKFLSTPSARRATFFSTRQTTSKGDFYPRPPRGGRPTKASWCLSIWTFLSTPSARRATV